MSHSNKSEDVKRLPLFGGSRPWTAAEWKSQDDRVRGGSSVSYLIPSPEATTAIFNGILDTKTLGGAGFASQRTAQDKIWNLIEYEGIEIVVVRENCNDQTNKTFTFVLKDVIPAPYNDQTTGRPREESTISYEATFRPRQGKKHNSEQLIFLPFKDFKPTYRGREKPDAPEVDLSNICRFSLMARSFFDNQSGPFQLTLVSITAVTRPKGSLWGQDPEVFYDEYDNLDGDYDEDDMDGDERRIAQNGQSEGKGSWWGGCLLQ